MNVQLKKGVMEIVVLSMLQLPEQSHALVHSKGPDKERYLPSL